MSESNIKIYGKDFHNDSLMIIESKKSSLEIAILTIAFILIIFVIVLIKLETINTKHDQQKGEINQRMDKIIEFMRCEK